MGYNYSVHEVSLCEGDYEILSDINDKLARIIELLESEKSK